jgi:hypothetical protein
MIKIPKSFDELKQIVSTVNLGDTLSKVQSTVNTAMDAAKPTLVEGELGEIIDQLKKLQEQEVALLNRLATLTSAFQKQIAEAKAEPPAPVVPVSPTVTAAPVEPVVATPLNEETVAPVDESAMPEVDAKP